ncbi:hypothetical protein R6Q59_016494 [Mikania micrantha]
MFMWDLIWSNLIESSLSHRREAKFIQKIVTKISLKLHLINWSIDEKLVGMEERVKNVISSLEVESADDVRMIGIWGMGGAGKTTLARAVCDHISIWFEGKSFVENVRERSKGGLRELQRQLLKDVLNDQSIDITGVFDGINKMKKMMPGRKVLVVLDDVDHIEHLEALAGELTWFKPGSRIFITTRDKQVLVAQGVHVDNIYNISLLSDEEAICLFSRTEPIWLETLERLKTIPLEETLKKLEISYDGLEKEYKEIFLDIACILKDEQKNKAIRILESCGFHAQIGLEVLEQKSLINISYNGYLGMHDHIEEMSRNIVRRLHPGEPNRHSRLWVKEEIREILVNDLGTKATRSMILKHMDINPAVVMKSLRKMKKIKLLYVNDNKVFPYRVFGQIDVGGVQYLPDTLRCLIWADYPFFRLPKTFQANNLVYLKMPRSCISQLWEGGERKVLKKLKFVDLSYSNLRTFDLGMTRNLETLDLRSCIGLVEHQMPVPLPMLKDLNLCGSKVSNLNLEMTPNLKVLKLMDCYYLQEIHAPVGCLKYLTRLNLSGCLRFEYFEVNTPYFSLCVNSLATLNLNAESLDRCPLHPNSNFSPRVDSLAKLELIAESLDRCPLHPNSNFPKFKFQCKYGDVLPLSSGNLEKLLSFELPKDLWKLESLEQLTLCMDKIKHLPDNICMLKHLKSLELRCCLRLEQLPMDLGGLECLEELRLTYWTSIRDIPDSICQLKCLKKLHLSNCHQVEKWPDELGRLECLEVLNIKYAVIRCLPESIIQLKHLKSLDLTCCELLEQLPMDLGGLECLEELRLTYCRSLRDIPDSICRLKCLILLDIEGAGISRLPESIIQLKHLKSLDLACCELLEQLPMDLGGLECLEKLNLSKCRSLRDIPDSICQLKCLKLLNIDGAGISRLPEGIFQLKKLRIIGGLRGSLTCMV